MIDRRKRKPGQSWRLAHEVMSLDGNWMQPGVYGIYKVYDNENPPVTDLILYKNAYGESISDSHRHLYRYPRRSISTAEGVWEYVNETIPEFQSKPYTVFCSVCGSNAEVLVSVIRPSYVCRHCTNNNQPQINYA